MVNCSDPVKLIKRCGNAGCPASIPGLGNEKPAMSQKTITKDIDAYEAAISQLEVDITNYDQLIKFITIYHGQVMIDKFKRIKQTAYYRLLKTMSTREISNSHHHATLAHSILTL